MFNKKKVVVIGAGISGQGAVKLLLDKGAKVYVYDDVEERAQSLAKETGAKVVCGDNFPSVLSTCEYAVLSPGISVNSNVSVMAQALGVRVLSEIELAYFFCKGKILSVTGTNGKSSMVRLIGAMLSASGKRAHVCGNIGIPFTCVVDNVCEDEYAVVEVSSFQLETISEFKPHVAVFLNIKPDHLDRHATMEEYVKTKARLVKNMKDSDIIVGNYDDKNVRDIMEKSSARKLYFSTKSCVPEGVYLDGSDIVVNFLGRRYRAGEVSDIANIRTPQENALALLTVALAFDVQFGIIYKCLREFAPLPHTMQKIRSHNGINYVDDSKGTNISATLCAVRNIDGKVVLICGGRTKGENYAELFGELPSRIVGTVCVGENAEELMNLSSRAGISSCIAKNVSEAVFLASKEIEDCGGTVLFSPATASFDLYSNYAERGKAFVDAVRAYAQE